MLLVQRGARAKARSRARGQPRAGRVALAVWAAATLAGAAPPPAAAGTKAAGSAASAGGQPRSPKPAEAVPLTGRLDAIRARLPAPGSGQASRGWVEAAEALGRWIARAREQGVPAQRLERAIALAERIAAGAEAEQQALESAAGDDEAALERLLASERWKQLSFAQVLAGYWAAWARLDLADALGPGRAAQSHLRRAEAGFASASLELGLPRMVAGSFLGLGAARRRLGDLEGARRALSRLESLPPGAVDPKLRRGAELELTRVALAQGRLEETERRIERLRGLGLAGAPLRPLRLELLRAWLERLGSDPHAAEAAAKQIRALVLSDDALAREAVRLALAHADALAGESLGGLEEVLQAERAISAGRYAEASRALARALAAERPPPGLDPSELRYRRAYALAQAGEEEQALAELEVLARAPLARELALRVARLRWRLALRQAGSSSSSEASARLHAAARSLLEIDAEGPDADRARLWLAQATETGSERSRSRSEGELEEIPPQSPLYPQARWELMRLRALRLAQLEKRRHPRRAALRRAGAELKAALDRLEDLKRLGKLHPSEEEEAELALLRAHALAATGAPPDAVLEALDRIPPRVQRDPVSRSTALRLRLEALARLGRYDELLRIARATDTDPSREPGAWRAALAVLAAARGPSVPAELVAALGGLGSRSTKLRERRWIELDLARGWLRAERPERAARIAAALVEADPRWGEAWVVRAEALEASRHPAEAAHAWKQVAEGTSPGSSIWLRAQLARVRLARALEGGEQACVVAGQALAALAKVEAKGSDSGRARLEREARSCGSDSDGR